MRSLVLVLLALACPIGMCLGLMLLMRLRGRRAASCHTAPAVSGDEVEVLRSEVAALRAELDAREISEQP